MLFLPSMFSLNEGELWALSFHSSLASGDDFKACAGIAFGQIFLPSTGHEPDQVIVPEERSFWKAAKDIYTAANWDKLHALLILSAVRTQLYI